VGRTDLRRRWPVTAALKRDPLGLRSLLCRSRPSGLWPSHSYTRSWGGHPRAALPARVSQVPVGGPLDPSITCSAACVERRPRHSWLRPSHASRHDALAPRGRASAASRRLWHAASGCACAPRARAPAGAPSGNPVQPQATMPVTALHRLCRRPWWSRHGPSSRNSGHAQPVSELRLISLHAGSPPDRELLHQPGTLVGSCSSRSRDQRRADSTLRRAAVPPASGGRSGSSLAAPLASHGIRRASHSHLILVDASGASQPITRRIAARGRSR